MSDDERELSRQEQIWAGLYGPPRAAALVAEARERLAADPAGDVRTILADLEPSDDDGDLDEAGTMRPGVG